MVWGRAAIGSSQSLETAHRVHGLPALLDRVANQAHPAQLSGDEEAGHVRLEVGADLGNIDAARRGAEDQRDRVRRARAPARAVPYAVRRVAQLGAPIDDAEHALALRTRGDARPAPGTEAGVDHGMQRRGFRQAF